MEFASKLLIFGLVTLLIVGHSLGDSTIGGIPFLLGPHCLDSNIVSDTHQTWFEFKLKLRNYKEYYRISNTLTRSFQVSKSFQLQNQSGDGYWANINFILKPHSKFIFCDLSAFGHGCSVTRSRSDTVLMQVFRGNKALDLANGGYEYEAEMWFKSLSSEDTVRSRTVTAKPLGLFPGIRFDFSYDFNLTKFDSIIGVGSDKDAFELDLVVRQFTNTTPSWSSELQSNCKLW